MEFVAYIGPGVGITSNASWVMPLLFFSPVISFFAAVLIRESWPEEMSVAKTILAGCVIHVMLVAAGVLASNEHLTALQAWALFVFAIWPMWLALAVASCYGLARACLSPNLRLTPSLWEPRRGWRAVALLVGSPVGVAVACLAGLPAPFLIFACLTGLAFAAFALDEVLTLESEARLCVVPVQVRAEEIA